MTTPLRLVYLDPAELAANPGNPKFHPAEQLQAITELESAVGFAGALLYNERTKRLLDGHGRRELWAGKPAPVLIGDWDEAQERKIVAFLDATGFMGRIDSGMLAALTAGDDLLRDVGASSQLAELLGSMREAAETMRAPAGDGHETPSDTRAGVTTEPGDQAGAGRVMAPRPPRPSAREIPDAIWPTADAFGVPLLDVSMQADAVEFPVSVWGTQAQHRAMRGTWVFYTADEAFSSLWGNPAKVLPSSAPCLVEPNYSTHEQTPFAVELWGIYRRRWLNRYWQSQGRRTFVDLNVHHRLLEPCEASPACAPAFLGVPKGWKAFATRSHGDNPAMLEVEHDRALAHSGGPSLLFLVYGGGTAVRDLCRARGWVWVPEQSDTVRGRHLDAIPEPSAAHPG